MSRCVYSAFADEISESFDIQIESLHKLDIGMLELRGVDGKSFTELSPRGTREVKKKLAAGGIGLSALGTPLGKIFADGDMKAHLALMDRIMDIGDTLGAKRLRVFSFYKPEGMSAGDFRERVFENTERMLERAEKRGFVLCHENEKDIYGYNAPREKELLDNFGGRLKAVLDPGNFAFCLEDASLGYPMLKDYVEYFHIKDADATGAIVPPGKGVAGLEDILRAVNKDRNGEVVLTIEPHLMDFTGLASLSKLDDIKHVYTFETPFEAFEYAFNSVKEMVNRIG